MWRKEDSREVLLSQQCKQEHGQQKSVKDLKTRLQEQKTSDREEKRVFLLHSKRTVQRNH